MKIVCIRKRQLYILIITIIIFLLVFILFKNRTISTISTGMNNKIIGIDPGHGGMDPGTVSKNGIGEADINLKIALKLKEIIESNGGKVVLTRKDNKALSDIKREDLEGRKEIIEKNKCHIFLTIHLNSFTDPKYYGAQVFYKKESNESMDLADCIQEELRKTLDEENNRVPQEREDVYLLRELDMAAVLIECGFLSNPREEKLLQSENYQRKIAQGIYKGLTKYFDELEKNRE